MIVKNIRGLRSAGTTNLSAALDLHSASCFTSNRTGSTFQPVANKYKGLIKSKMQQHLVNFSLPDAISIAKLDIDTYFQPAGLGVHGLHSANSTLPSGLGLRSANSSIFQQALACNQQTPPIWQQALVCTQQVGIQTRCLSWLLHLSKTSTQKVQASCIFLPQTTIQFHHSSLLLSQLLREHLKSFFGHLAS